MKRFAAIPILLLALSALPRGSSAAELAVFVSGARQGSDWGGGVGGSFTFVLLNLVGLEVEGARQKGDVPDSSMFSVSGRAFLGPSIGRLVPYGGLSVGVYRQSLGGLDDWGTASGAFLGLKVKLPLGVVAKAEYQRISLPTAALIPMEARYYVGAGISF